MGKNESNNYQIKSGINNNDKSVKNKNENRENLPERPMSHRVFAWIAIFLLVGMYTITLISAISGSGTTSALFMMSLGSTVVIPGLLWLYIRFWKFSMNRDRETFGVGREQNDAKKNDDDDNDGDDDGDTQEKNR